ncbi:MAG TPA: AAA family ATPase [Chitinophagaceae bacterium]|jgi:AAA15 family ATPase/GTPase|nr:AAA family ATPase [Chitinophagaceae bacterium]
MQIISAAVKNFKSLFDTSISGFSSVNFIFGYNNSGKSNLLKFLQLLFSKKTIETVTTYDDNGITRTRRRIDTYTPFWQGYIYDMPFMYSGNNRSTRIEFEVRFDVKKEELPFQQELLAAGYLYPNRDTVPLIISGEIISINISDSEISLNEVILKGRKIYSKVNGERFFEEPNDSDLTNREDIFTSIMDIFTDCVLLVESDRFFNIEKENESIVNAFNSNTFKSWLYNLSLDSERFEKFSGLIDFLNHFNVASNISNVLTHNLRSFPLKTTKLTFARFKEELEIMLENSIGRFPLKNYGTGIQQILYILSKIFDTTSKILLIEELELNLSPEYQELILNNLKNFVASRKLSQVFFTSHSDYLYRSDFKIFEVSINNQGKTRIASSRRTALRQLRRAYLNYTGK